VQRALALMEIDHLGLDNMDRKLLRTIIEKFGGGPVGIDTLSTAISEERDTIEDVYEPFLIQKGYINRTPRGRVATKLAYEYLGLKPEDAAQGDLFT
jgi:Holliday junction DNA helicase RuvB